MDSIRDDFEPYHNPFDDSWKSNKLSYNIPESSTLTPMEDLFLNTLARRICEILKYDISKVEPLKTTISNLHTKQVKSKGIDKQKDLSFFEALEKENRTYAKFVKKAMDEVTISIKATHNDNPQDQTYDLLKGPNTATFGQDLSKRIGQAMTQKLTGQTWD